MSSGGGAGPLVPTFHGFVHNSMDGLVLFEACLSGKLHHVPRRPHDRERSSLIKSGSIFIYEENASGIKRWTDGVAWSPSRILGNFLIYRELEKPFPPGEKKRAMKRKRASLPGEPFQRRDSDDAEGAEMSTPLTPPTPPAAVDTAKPELQGNDQDKELERALIGSLVDSYGFRPDGLVKKTMSISINGISHHMVSYYKVDDVKNNMLPRPLSDARLQNISVRPELYLKQNFRAPVEETEQYAIDGQMHAHPHMMYSSMAAPGGYGVRPGQYFGQQYPGMYSMNPTTTANMYGGMTGTAWPAQPTTAGPLPYGSHPGYSNQGYSGSYYKSGTSPSGATPVKTEDSQANSQASPYGNPYGSSYPGMSRAGSQSTPNMMQSAYQTPVQPASSSFNSISAQVSRPQYPGTPMQTPATNGSSQHMYASAPPQPYAVRSPSQSYSIQNAAAGPVSQSPHPGMKSPPSAAHPGTPASAMSGVETSGQMNNSSVPYRSGSYALPTTPQSAHPGSDMSGLGISNTSSYPSQPQSGHTYPPYNPSGPPYRSVGDVGTAQGGAQYSQ